MSLVPVPLVIKRFIALFSACVLLLAIPLSSGSAASRELRLAYAGSPDSLDPLLATAVDDESLSALVFDTLLDPTPTVLLKPRLAVDVPSLANRGISADGRTVTFRLRRGVRWQDGKPFSSADVAFTIRLILDPKTPIADRSGYDDISSVATSGPNVVVFHLERRYAPFVDIIGTKYPVLPEHLLAHTQNIAQDPFGAQPVGTGPYRFVRQSRGDRIEYAANDSYWRGKPKIDRVAVLEIPDFNTQAIEMHTGQLDYTVGPSPSTFQQMRRDRTIVTETAPRNSVSSYVLNTSRPPLDDVRLRRAISMAVDRATLVRNATFGLGTVAYADLPAFMWRSSEPANPYGYDPAAAGRLLDSAGWRRGPDGIRVKNGKPLRLLVITQGRSTSGNILDAEVQAMLRNAGIDIELKGYDPDFYFSPASSGGPLEAGNFDMAFSSFAGSGDPFNQDLYACANRAPNGGNAARYCSAKMDALQAASLAELDPRKRLAIVAKIEDLAARDVPYIFLYNGPFRFAHAKALHGSGPMIGGSYYNHVEDWSFDT